MAPNSARAWASAGHPAEVDHHPAKLQQPLVAPKTLHGLQLDRLPVRADFTATPSVLNQKGRRGAQMQDES